MKSRKFTVSLLAVLLAVCCSFSAFAEEGEVSLTDLDLGEVEEVEIEAPLISSPLLAMRLDALGREQRPETPE